MFFLSRDFAVDALELVEDSFPEQAMLRVKGISSIAIKHLYLVLMERDMNSDHQLIA